MTNTLERSILRTAAKVCTPRQWEALCLRYVEDLSVRETGVRMGVGERAAGRLIDRALTRIHEARKERAA